MTHHEDQEMPDGATSGGNTGGDPADCFKCKNPVDDDWVKGAGQAESDKVGGCCDRCAEAQAVHNAKCDKVGRRAKAKLDSIGCPSNVTEKCVPVDCPGGNRGNRGNCSQPHGRGCGRGHQGGCGCAGGGWCLMHHWQHESGKIRKQENGKTRRFSLLDDYQRDLLV